MYTVQYCIYVDFSSGVFAASSLARYWSSVRQSSVRWILCNYTRSPWPWPRSWESSPGFNVTDKRKCDTIRKGKPVKWVYFEQKFKFFINSNCKTIATSRTMRQLHSRFWRGCHLTNVPSQTALLYLREGKGRVEKRRVNGRKYKERKGWWQE